MNEVSRAYALDAENKQLALELYKKCAAIIISPHYRPACECAFTDLSAVFGMHWLAIKGGDTAFWQNAELYAESNVAFNYANLTLAITDRFVTLAKTLAPASMRVSDERIKQISRQLNQVLKNTTAERVGAALRAA